MRVKISFGPLFLLVLLWCSFLFFSCCLSHYVYGDELVDRPQDDARFLSVDSLGKKNRLADEEKSSPLQDSSASGSFSSFSSSGSSSSRGRSSLNSRKIAEQDGASVDMFLRMKSFLTASNPSRKDVAKSLTMKRGDEGGNLAHSLQHPGLSFYPFSMHSFSQHSSERGVLSPSSSSSPQKSRLSLAKISGSVVKIFVDSASPDYISPWQMKAPQQTTGSGFAIEGKRLLTNAHVVAHQTRVLVRRHGIPLRFLAEVLAVSHEADLALLGVRDETFWQDMVPLPFGGVPQLQDRITVLGYPTGGDQLSITEGVVSRVGVSRYIHASFSLLTAQIDAAINPGNSGGPAVVNGLVVGVAFEGFNQLQNIGYVVPYPVIQQFLHDLTLHGRYTGIPTLGVKTFDMENPSMRRAKGLDDASLKDKLPAGISLSGVLIVEVDQLRTRRHLTGKIRLPVASWPIQHEFKSSSSLLLSQPSSPSSPSRLSSSPVPPSSLAQPPFPHHHQHPAMGLGTGDNRHERLRHLEEEEEPSIRSSSSLLSAEGEKKNKEDKDEDALEERKKETKKNRKSVSPSSSATSKKNEAVRPTVSQGLSPSFIERQRLKRYLSSRAGERHFLSYLAREGGSFSFMHSSSRGLTKEILSKEKPFVAEKEEKGDEEDRHSRFKTEGSQVSVGSSSDIETTGDEEEDVHSQGDGDQKEKESNRERYEERGGKNKRKMDEGEGKTTEEEEEGRRRNGQGEKEEEKERDSLRTAHSNTGGEGRHHLVDNPYFNEEMRRHLQKASSDHTLGLRSGDVLLSIENIDIANDGTVPFRGLERVSLEYALLSKFNGQMTWAYVLRDRQILKVSIPLSIEDKLVPPHVWDTSPKYFVYGGLVFTALTKKFVKGKMGTSDGTPVFLLNYVEQGRFQEEEDDEIVLLSSILASDVTIGYEAAPSVVVSVQGEKVQNLSQLAFLIETSKDPFITFVLEIQGSRNLPLILDRKDAKRVTKDILEKHRIRSDRSLHYKLLHSPFSS